ncbi:hypothetical protein ACFPJ1_06290 [Kribbella qitaiheensis]|uniref:hypothetical protein n=1 Tax=Kribbella qitaiheensis TaxID=1544730 RepID=UPI00360AB24E
MTITARIVTRGSPAGIGLSAAVEAVQALIPQLGRSCQLQYLVANSLGAVAGVGLAATVQLVLRSVSGPHTLTRPMYVVEHSAVLAVRRPPARHRRAELAPAMAKSSCRLRPVARAR